MSTLQYDIPELVFAAPGRAPGGGGAPPGGHIRTARATNADPPARASRGRRRIPNSCAVRHRGSHGARPRRCRPRHVHCACCGGCSCPQGSPGGHRTPEPGPQCTLLTRTSTPVARASCPAHGHYGTAPGAAASEQGWLRAMWGTQEIPEGPLEASETHPSTRSHTNLQIRANSR